MRPDPSHPGGAAPGPPPPGRPHRLALALYGCLAVATFALAGCAHPRTGPAAAPTVVSQTAVSQTAGTPAGSARSTAPRPRSTLTPGTTRYPTGQGPPLPALRGTTLDGATAGSDDLRGHVAVINVWGSWCVPCREESSVLAAAAQRYGSRVRFLGIDVVDDDAAARAFLARVGIDYPNIRDPDGALLARLGEFVPATAVPSTLVVDPRGRIAVRIIGAATAESLRQAVTATLAAG